MPMTEDLTAFFQTTEHATAAYFNESETAINVIFDEEYTDFNDDVASTNPEAMCRTSDVTSVEFARDKKIVIGSYTYRIRNARPDMSGDVLTLELERQGYL